MSDLTKRLEELKQSNTTFNSNTNNEQNYTTSESLEDIAINDDFEEQGSIKDYSTLIKNDYDSLSDDEISETREAAFESFKEDLQNMKKENDEGVVNESERQKTAAEIYEEKHPIIKMDKNNKPVEEKNDMDPGESLFGNISEIEKDSAQMSAQLQKLQNEYIKSQEVVETTLEPSNDDVDSHDSVEDILSSIEENNAKKDLGIEEVNDDLTAMLEKFEGQKQYSTYIENKEHTGPSSYIIENADYLDSVEDVLKENNINIVKKNNSERSAILDRFVNSGDTVTVPLVNSGIYITVSGGSVPEIMAMNDISGDSDSELILNKLNVINTHIVGSSIGKMRLGQLIKVISYYDIETMYYAFYAGTYPEFSEISRNCSKCGQEYFIKMNTRDLLRNPEDFVEDAKDIRDNVTTYEILREKSLLNKVIAKSFMHNQVIAYIKHPSIESYINTRNNLSQNSIDKYAGNLLDIIYSIDKICLHDVDNKYIEITDPNVILDVISKIKDTNFKFELLDMIDEIRPNAIPSYGYMSTNCPNCGHSEESAPFAMEDLLFTQAQQEDQMATLRWAAKLQKRRQSKKK